MTSALRFVVWSLLGLAFASVASAATPTCRTLGAAYQNDVDATAEALRANQRCTSTGRNIQECLPQLLAFQMAQEGLQAAFSSYAKSCVDRLA